MGRVVIPKAQLKHGQYYEGHCRNASIARWNADQQLFYHWCTKFERRFVETICCQEDDQVFDVFLPYKEIDYGVEEIPFTIT